MKKIIGYVLIVLLCIACEATTYTATVTAKTDPSMLNKTVTIGEYNVAVTDEEFNTVNVGDVYTCTFENIIHFSDCVKQEQLMHLSYIGYYGGLPSHRTEFNSQLMHHRLDAHKSIRNKVRSVSTVMNLTEWSKLTVEQRKQWLKEQSPNSLSALLVMVGEMLLESDDMDAQLSMLTEPSSDVVNARNFTYNTLRDFEKSIAVAISERYSIPV